MELAYTVVYSNRKSIGITVERDRSVVVHAPSGTPADTIQAVLDAKRLWLFEKIHHAQKYAPPAPPGKELVNGESLLYLGRAYRIELVDEEGEIEFHHKFLVPRRLLTNRGAAFQAWYKQKAAEKIVPRTHHFAHSLGVTFNEVKITDSQYRWGSCTPANNLHFNWRLIKAPMFVIDYVIVHELAHLLEPNHTERFWTIVHAQIPQVDQAKAWLKENGALLEQNL